MKYLIIFSILLFSCHSQSRKEVDNRSSISKMIQRTVRVERQCLGLDGAMHKAGYGSGVVLASGVEKSIIITAKHVIENKECLYDVIDYRNQHNEASVMSASEDGDIGTLQIKNNLHLKTEVDLKPYLGQEVTCVGYPGNPLDEDKKYLSVTKGNIATLWVNNEYIRVTTEGYFGSSGGPCFSNQGKLIGVFSAMWGGFVGNQYFPRNGQYYITPVKFLYPVH